MNQEFVEVAVDAPIRYPLTYLWESETERAPERGTSVKVPLGRGKRKVSAVVLGQGQNNQTFQLKPINSVEQDRPRIPAPYMEWLEWVSDYYAHPLGQVTSLCFPPLKRAVKPRKSKRPPVIPKVKAGERPHLTEEQTRCLNDLNSRPNFGVHLLHGVTGSGKTEVYLRFLDNVILSGKRGLVLVPEISLTPQLLARFSSRFPDEVAVIHSHLTDRERTDQWLNVYDKKKKILIGARSALFCPIDDLGAIIIDEEHEPSFKQEEKLKYHARDAAIVLAKAYNCPIILGSATPSLESWRNVRSGKYHYYEMKARVSDRPLPEITVVDMREEKEYKKNHETESLNSTPFWMSRTLKDQILNTFERGLQSALFLNRRGIAQTVLCGDCGHVVQCPNCEISLTLHQQKHLVCHYCEYTEPLKERCTSCAEGEVIPLGLGTEKVEDDLKRLLPNAKISRADRDEIQSREDLEALITAMEEGQIDILVGTQMIAKGLDFPRLVTVGLVMADIGFNLPDFRSTERAYQLLTQVSGRAGRHTSAPGQVVIQTYNPEHPSIQFAKGGTFAEFADWELENRSSLSYPPFSRLASIRISGLNHNRVKEVCSLIEKRTELLRPKNKLYTSIVALGPAPSPLAKIRNKYRYHMLIKGPNPKTLKGFCSQLLSDQSWVKSGVKLALDIDPINML